jgi:hypothetical protein
MDYGPFLLFFTATSQTSAELPERGQKKEPRDGHITGLLHRSMAKAEETSSDRLTIPIHGCKCSDIDHNLRTVLDCYMTRKRLIDRSDLVEEVFDFAGKPGEELGFACFGIPDLGEYTQEIEEAATAETKPPNGSQLQGVVSRLAHAAVAQAWVMSNQQVRMLDKRIDTNEVIPTEDVMNVVADLRSGRLNGRCLRRRPERARRHKFFYHVMYRGADL